MSLTKQFHLSMYLDNNDKSEAELRSPTFSYVKITATSAEILHTHCPLSSGIMGVKMLCL